VLLMDADGMPLDEILKLLYATYRGVTVSECGEHSTEWCLSCPESST
jgi:hypothetical protein